MRSGLWEDASLLLTAYGLLDSADKIDWGKILDLAEEQSVVGLLAAGIEVVKGAWLKLHGAHLVPKPMALQFIGRTVLLEQRNQAMNYFIGGLVEKMREAGIYTMLVKGQGVAQCYERPLWRSCGDVDLFLSEEDYANAKVFLSSLASSVKEEFVREKHLSMTIDGWTVELHGHLYSGLSPRVDGELRTLQQETFENKETPEKTHYVRIWKNGSTDIPLLSAENDTFYVFTHILQHFYKGGIGLRQICDWCRLLYTYRESLNVGLLESRIMQAGLMREWKAFGAFAVNYLGMPIEAMPFLNMDECANLEKKADRICRFIIKVGNFGHNRDTSYYGKYPFVVRKAISAWRRTKDIFHHIMIFPLDSLRFFPYILWNGLRSAARGE